jgi:excisionase family DNA binding protein
MIPDEYLPPDRVAEILGVTTGTLAKWRHRGASPAYAIVGRRCLYPADKLREFIESRIRRSTSEEVDHARS